MPSRSLIGLRAEFQRWTRGNGIMTQRFLNYEPLRGQIGRVRAPRGPTQCRTAHSLSDSSITLTCSFCPPLSRAAPSTAAPGDRRCTSPVATACCTVHTPHALASVCAGADAERGACLDGGGSRDGLRPRHAPGARRPLHHAGRARTPPLPPARLHGAHRPCQHTAACVFVCVGDAVGRAFRCTRG